MEVTLIAETLDPSKGGIPRYNYEISKIKEIKNVVDFSKSLSNEGLSNKLLNKLYRRKNVLEKNADKLGKVLHFTQPEVMVKTSELRKRKVILTVHDLAVFKNGFKLNINGTDGSIEEFTKDGQDVDPNDYKEEFKDLKNELEIFAGKESFKLPD